MWTSLLRSCFLSNSCYVRPCFDLLLKRFFQATLIQNEHSSSKTNRRRYIIQRAHGAHESSIQFHVSIPTFRFFFISASLTFRISLPSPLCYCFVPALVVTILTVSRRDFIFNLSCPVPCLPSALLASCVVLSCLVA